MFYSPTCYDLNTWFELSRVKLYRNDLKETEITSSLREVRVTEGKIMVNVRTKSKGSRLWFELARGSSLRGFELSGVNCTVKLYNLPNYFYRGLWFIAEAMAAVLVDKNKSFFLCWEVNSFHANSAKEIYCFATLSRGLKQSKIVPNFRQIQKPPAFH